MACNLRLVSWNVGGLKCKFKRSLMFDYLKKYIPHILFFFQETYLQGSRVLSLKRGNIAAAYHATYFSYSWGVSTLVTKTLPIHVQTVKTDPYGRFVFLC